jgi:UDP-glucuronate 4-epimerase
MNFLPMQPGDVVATYADVEELKLDVGFQPATQLANGIERWVKWYRSYKNNIK